MAGKPKKKAKPSGPARCAVLWGLDPSSERGAAVRAVLREMDDETRAAYIAKNPDYGVIVCRCEEITKGEIRRAVHDGMFTLTEIRRYLRDNSAVRVSRSMRDTAYKVLQAREKLLAENQREPTVEQIARYLDIPREDVVFAMDAIVDPVSLYEPVYADGGGDAVCVMDQVRDERNSDESWLDRIALKEAISRLDPRERHILALRFCQGKTQMEVSSEIGISQAQVSRLEKGAINSIRRNM